jgi:hypothetical protein
VTIGNVALVLGLYIQQMRLQLGHDLPRKHGYPVAITLAATNGHDLAREIEIVHPQAQSLH